MISYFLFVFVLIIAMCLNSTELEGNQYTLDKSLTDCLKFILALTVFFGHTMYFSEGILKNIDSLFSVKVALFFFISGYGLVRGGTEQAI